MEKSYLFNCYAYINYNINCATKFLISYIYLYSYDMISVLGRGQFNLTTQTLYRTFKKKKNQKSIYTLWLSSMENLVPFI